MAKEHYNFLEFKKILKLQEYNPKYASQRFEKYLEKYPDDTTAIIHYIGTLLIIKDTLKAKDLLSSVNINVNIGKISEERINMLKGDLLFIKLKLLFYEEKYEEIVKLIENNECYFKNNNFDSALFYAKQKIGQTDFPHNGSYLFSQIMNYSEAAFKEHIKEHINGISLENDSFFYQDFPMDIFLNEIKKYIPSDNYLFRGLYEDVYTFRYDNCGRDQAKSTNFIRTIAFHNTANIITLYPASGYDNVDCIDLNYLKNEENHNVKRLSQVDKFKQKYNM